MFVCAMFVAEFGSELKVQMSDVTMLLVHVSCSA